MKTNAFVLLLAGVLVLGGSLGGAFVGGLVMGKSQGEAAAQQALTAQLPVASGQQGQGQPTAQEQLQQLRQQALSGQLTEEQVQEQISQLRQRFLDQGGQLGAGGAQGSAGRGGLAGTVEKIEGDTVTINTVQGPLLVTVGSDTTIQITTAGTIQDLTIGLRVTVAGQRGADGTVTANSILVTPEGVDLFGGRRQQDPPPSP